MSEEKYQAKNRDGEYFAGWKATPWETIKRIAIWSTNRDNAVWMRQDEIAELTYGYGKMITRKQNPF